jgi:Methyltransferase domain
MRRTVRDDPDQPDPAFAELYASFPDATRLDPWLGWCREAGRPVLYLGIGAGRLAVPLAAAGVELVGVDAHPGMLERLRSRLPRAELVLARIEELDLGRRFPLVIGPSSVLDEPARLAAAARHSARRVALELMNPHWLLEGEHPTVRVRAAGGERLEIEVDYPGGWTHRSEARPVWPEAVEELLAGAGLTLELMRGQDPDAGLVESPTYFVLARARARGSKRSRIGPADGRIGEGEGV